MKNPMSNGNKNRTSRVLMMAMLMCLMFSPQLTDHTYAQVFLSDEDYNENRANVTDGALIPVLPQDLEVDWIPSPIGEGWLLLASFGGAYLLGKRRKEE